MAVYDRDYLTTLPLLYENAAIYSGGDWNKYNSDIGDALLQLTASMSHSVDYYFRDFLSSLVLPNDDWDKKSLIWELTGYKPNYIRADYMMIQLYWPDCGLNSYVPLYKYTPFKITADGEEYTFLCAQDYFIPPRTTRMNVRLVNGIFNSIDEDYTQIPANNKIKLSDNDLDYDLVTLIVSGEKWTQVRNVYYSPNTERIFSLHKEEDGTYLYLHSTWRQYVDAYDTSFVIYYVESSYSFSMYTSECMEIEFVNPLLTVDGVDVTENYRIIPLITSDEALSADNLMPSTTEGNRAITTLDYESCAALFPGLSTCRAYDWNTFSVCKEPFKVHLIACDKNGTISDHMKLVLKDYLEAIGSPLIDVFIQAPILAKQNILVVLDVGDYRGTLTEIQIKQTVMTALKDFYAIGNLQPGRIVKTKELNSLIMHAEPRALFATTSFINSLTKSPYIIPILGDVVIITSADAFTYYEFGKGLDRAFPGPKNIELCEFVDKSSGLEQVLFKKIHVGALNVIDKLPMLVFEAPVAEDKSRPMQIGAGEYVSAEFGVEDGFVHILKTGGTDETGPVYLFVYETDGSAVLGTVTHEISTRVESELKFVNGLGTYFVDPGITTIDVSVIDPDLVKDKLAEAFNAIPNLYDENGVPFNINGSDMRYLGPLPVATGSMESRVWPLSGSQTDADSILGNSAAELHEIDSGAILGASQDDYLIYVPFNRALQKAIVMGGFNAQTVDAFVEKDRREHSVLVFPICQYSGRGRYQPQATAYGEMQFNARTTFDLFDVYHEFQTSVPDIYSGKATYGDLYYIRETNGNVLTWYFCDTSKEHYINHTTVIGKGINVKFLVNRDVDIYVETDVSTGRGFIYSSEMQAGDFEIWEIG